MDEEGYKGAVNYTAKCAVMRGPWCRFDGMAENWKFLYVSLGFTDQYARSWALTKERFQEYHQTAKGKIVKGPKALPHPKMAAAPEPKKRAASKAAGGRDKTQKTDPALTKYIAPIQRHHSVIAKWQRLKKDIGSDGPAYTYLKGLLDATDEVMVSYIAAMEANIDVSKLLCCTNELEIAALSGAGDATYTNFKTRIPS